VIPLTRLPEPARAIICLHDTTLAEMAFRTVSVGQSKCNRYTHEPVIA
jgi:hypothetical protein